MDWYLDSSDLTSIAPLRHEFDAYLTRHAAEGSDISGAVLTFAELVNNAAEHATGPVWISVDWTSAQPLLAVHDLGPGFELASVAMPPPTQPRGRGLAIAADVAAELSVHAKAGGGSRVEAVLPVSRAAEESHDPLPTSHGLLPDLVEATPDGFGKEAFLRALVVQLAQETERTQGPGAAQALVAQVGAGVGAQMEAEFRATRSIVDRMTPTEVAECYVRLKHAIDGDFYVLEASEDRIILGNRRCPFGEAVQFAPALCRMTSSVFGGIAARNFGDAKVVLEERIAVGDSQCRVVVNLKPEAGEVGHLYSGPTD